jgi:hypothetical protein
VKLTDPSLAEILVLLDQTQNQPLVVGPEPSLAEMLLLLDHGQNQPGPRTAVDQAHQTFLIVFRALVARVRAD